MAREKLNKCQGQSKGLRIMLVSELVDQYLKTTDNDLKYMALRQELTVLEVGRDLNLLVNKVLMPVLLEEKDPEIVELVSSQVYPQLTLKCIVVMKRGNREPQWFNDLIVDPLMDHIADKRKNFIVQTLRNVLKVAVQSHYRMQSASDRHLGALVLRMKDHKGNNDLGQNTVLYWETLKPVISTYYYGTVKVPFAILKNIFNLCEGKLDSLVRSVLISSVEATTRQNVEKIVQESVSDSVLEAISTVWWQFGQLVPWLLEKRLLPALQQQETLLTNLQTIYNLLPFFQIASAVSGEKVLEDGLQKRLESKLQGLLENAAANSSAATTKEVVAELDVEDAEVDDAQQAYLDELQSDDDLEFDDEELLETDEDYQLKKLCQTILETLNDNKEKSSDYQSHKIDLTQVEVSALDETEDVVYTIQSTLENETTLQPLLLSVEILNQLLLTGHTEIDYSPVCQSLVRHMKQNKAFLQTIKVGNLTQTIDDGSTLRTMVHSTILQIITTRKLDYPTCCKLLIEAVSRSARDVDPTIEQLSLRIIENLLQIHYNTIRALDSSWYDQTLLPKAAETAGKLHKRLQTTLQNSEQLEPQAQTATILQELTSLFNVQYPAIE